MNILKTLCAIAFAAVAALSATPASAQATRTWVSGVGDDANPCSRTAPCKTFAGAISKTATGGEIDCLDPAGFGTVTITKSITIDCTGTFGSILSSSTFGVTLNAPNIIVVLRGLSISGSPPLLPGAIGVRVLQSADLTIEDSIIQNFTAGTPNGTGISVTATSGTVQLNLSNVLLTNNGSTGTSAGIFIAGGGSTAIRGNFDHVRVMNGANIGLRIDTTGNVGPGIAITVTNSQFSGNAAGGIVVNGPAGTTSGNLYLVDSTVANNTGTGLSVTGPTALVRVGNTTITGNTTGIAASGGASLLSFGDNRVFGNPIGFGAPANGTFSGADIPKD